MVQFGTDLNIKESSYSYAAYLESGQQAVNEKNDERPTSK